MHDTTSPLHAFYPLDFEMDGEGKRQDYEAVVLVPFIDKQLMLDAYNLVDQVSLNDRVFVNYTAVYMPAHTFIAVSLFQQCYRLHTRANTTDCTPQSCMFASTHSTRSMQR